MAVAEGAPGDEVPQVEPAVGVGAPPSSADERDPRGRSKAQRTVLLLIGGAGALGALARYALSRVLVAAPGHFVWSTFWINVTGSLVIGFVLVLLAERFPSARVARPLVVTGFLGGYTTFSTYAIDADLLLRARDLSTGAVYLLASAVVGVGATVVGAVLARVLLRLDRRLGEQVG